MMDLERLEIARIIVKTIAFKRAIDELVYGEVAAPTHQPLTTLLIKLQPFCEQIKDELYFALIEQIMLACPELSESPSDVRHDHLGDLKITKIKCNVIPLLCSLLKAKPSLIKARDQYGISLLMIAAATASESLARLFVLFGANRDDKCCVNGSPLGFKIGETAAHFVLRAKFSPYLLSTLLSDENTNDIVRSISYFNPWVGVGICERRSKLSELLTLIELKIEQIDSVIEGLKTQLVLNRFSLDLEEVVQDLIQLRAQRQYWMQQAGFITTLISGLEKLKQHHKPESHAELYSQLQSLRMAQIIRDGHSSDTAAQIWAHIIQDGAELKAARAQMRM